jgi:hypothetical protein
MRDCLLAIALMMGFLSLVVGLEIAPAATGPVAVIVDPLGGKRAYEVISAADGRLVRLGPWPWIAVGVSPLDPDFARSLRAAGAWLVLAPIATGACLDDLQT